MQPGAWQRGLKEIAHVVRGGVKTGATAGDSAIAAPNEDIAGRPVGRGGTQCEPKLGIWGFAQDPGDPAGPLFEWTGAQE